MNDPTEDSTAGRLDGKVALITGSDSGIGQATASTATSSAAASEADYVTGATCVMDGGLMHNLGQGA